MAIDARTSHVGLCVRDLDVVQIVFLADPDGNRIELMRLARGQAW